MKQKGSPVVLDVDKYVSNNIIFPCDKLMVIIYILVMDN